MNINSYKYSLLSIKINLPNYKYIIIIIKQKINKKY